MNSLLIEKREILYEADGKPQRCTQSEFVVDGRSLADFFDFSKERPWFGQTFFEEEGEAFEHERHAILGWVTPNNQLGSGRFILYRCHCGSAYCGVISCNIIVSDEHVRWLDIRYEDDFLAENDLVIQEYCFDKIQYRRAIEAN